MLNAAEYTSCLFGGQQFEIGDQSICCAVIFWASTILKLIWCSRLIPESKYIWIRIYIYMGLRENSGMDRPAVIQTYGSVWITCVLVWIGGMDRPVGSGYGSGLLHFNSQPYIYIYIIKNNLFELTLTYKRRDVVLM